MMKVAEYIPAVPTEAQNSFYHPLQKQLQTGQASGFARFSHPTNEINSILRPQPTREISFHLQSDGHDSVEEPRRPAEKTVQSYWKRMFKRTNEDNEDFEYGKDPKDTVKSLRSLLTKLVLPVALLVVAQKTGLIGRVGNWDRLEERHLNGRQCVMNLFVDKQEANEFNPDYSPTTKHAVPEVLEGTYRTKGQVEVINRFISSVAAAFRPNVQVQQHVVFCGTRDGGHLAQEALQHWPARGSYRTQLHVIADGTGNSGDVEYDSLDDIEDRFGEEAEDVHMYDSNGNIAGHIKTEDDDGVDEALRNNRNTRQREKFDSLPDIDKLVFDPDEEEESVIPYMHIDSISMGQQMEILKKATSLLKNRKVVVVGLEHAPDLNIIELIEYFRSVNYKTFMLGVRQLTRIDNLCPEILDNVMDHSSLSVKGAAWFDMGDDKKSLLKMPPFFVAMPKGRHSKEEMSIQHMYDLFSGASGLLQVKTANDREANVK